MEGKADIVIAPDRSFRPSPEINARKLYSVISVNVAHPEHPIHLEAIPLSESILAKYRGIAIADKPFERYADDVIVHCRSLIASRSLMREIDQRLSESGLPLHPEKTKVVYCKDRGRRADYPVISFDFLG